MIKYGTEKNTLLDVEIVKMREVIGNAERQPPDWISKLKKTFTSIKNGNHRKETVAKKDTGDKKQEEDMHYGRQSCPQFRNQKFVRSQSKPNFYREVRSKSEENGRSQSSDGDKKHWEMRSNWKSMTLEDKLDNITKLIDGQVS